MPSHTQKVDTMYIKATLVILFIHRIELICGQQCIPVFYEETHCVDKGPVSIQCSTDHLFLLFSAIIYKSVSPANGCPQKHSTREEVCLQANVYQDMKDVCKGQRTCTLTTPEQTTSNCSTVLFKSNYYLHLLYQCEPEESKLPSVRAVALCDSVPWTGVLARIDSDPLALLNTYITTSSCSCLVTVPPHTQLLLTPSVFRKEPTPEVGVGCDHRVEVILGRYRLTRDICQSSDTPIQLGCQDRETVYTVRYATSNDNIGVIFVLQLAVSLNSQFSMVCAQPYEPPTTTSTTTTTTTTMSTTTSTSTTTTLPGGPDVTAAAPPTDITSVTSHNSQTLGAIIGGVVAAFLLLLAICLIVFLRYRSNKRYQGSELESNEDFVNVTGIYLEGEKKSTLIIQKNPENTPGQVHSHA